MNIKRIYRYRLYLYITNKPISKQQIKTLGKPEFFEVIMQIFAENNYASAIASGLEKNNRQ
jgi:hypothetical protein